MFVVLRVVLLLAACAAARASDSEVWLRQAAVAGASGDWGASRALCDRAVAADAANARAFLQRAAASNRLREHAAAQDDAVRALSLGLPRPAAYIE
ncbi:MAG: hypothetical protein PHF00_13390, partial [Elusimicrobia bacterium]|nr:hypothetical protein [Elusimicrobiota bacterium]